ncbi:DUF5625 family protein [Sulfurisoma sediminicola]|uniref:DUF5625 domain-containing protein n=1 Tax=Sulfurisoma sediminicola TaxID=1381557 RepID=A0A497XLS7_9PROT|nr:DUF5625 family protein [Sulfurisoma sediminicola]RLJ68367.1 hypothetical protein DFR35_0927 [Sulfurisoma sediminicola]
MNNKKEHVIRSKRSLLALLALFPLLSTWAYAEIGIPTIPPGRFFKWDIAPKGSRIEVDFIVTEYRVYEFDIGFGNKNDPDAKDQSWRDDDKNWQFISGGRDKLNNGMYPHPSVVVPVHIKVEKLLNVSAAPALVTEQTIDTESRYAGGNLVMRRIIHQKLRPGKYRVTAITTRESSLPDSLGTYLRIGFYAKASILNDDE